MACPKCNCKVTYPLNAPDYVPPEEDFWERCANCGHIFDGELEAVDDDDDFDPDEKLMEQVRREAGE